MSKYVQETFRGQRRGFFALLYDWVRLRLLRSLVGRRIGVCNATAPSPHGNAVNVQGLGSVVLGSGESTV